MDTLQKLTELIDSLPPNSVTCANLLVVRGAFLTGPLIEDRLCKVLCAFARAEIQRLETVIDSVSKRSDPAPGD